MRIGEVASKKKSLTIQMDEGPLNIQYNASLYTPEYEQKIRKAARAKNGNKPEGEEEEEDGSADNLIKMISELVVSWDLEEDDSTPEDKKFVPIKPQRLNKLPITFLARIIREVTEDLFPNPSRSTPSGSFS